MSIRIGKSGKIREFVTDIAVFEILILVGLEKIEEQKRYINEVINEFCSYLTTAVNMK